MIENLGRLLSPRCVNFVTALEISWEVTKPPGYNSMKPDEWPEPVDLPFHMISLTFPGLRKLHVSLHGDIISTGEADVDDPATRNIIDIREQVICKEVDKYLSDRKEQLQHLYIALNWTLWSQLRTKASRKSAYIFEEDGYPGPRFWKHSGSNNLGYWIVEGRHGW